MDELRFDNRVAIVTGAARGLGREYALLLASSGAKVLVNDYGGGTEGKGSSSEPAESVVEEIIKAGGIAVPNDASVDTPEGGESIVAQALKEWGRVDIVMNNAGIVVGRSIHETTDDEMRKMFAVHILGSIFVTRPAWKVMVDQGYGRILNTSSGSVFGLENAYPYVTVKSGIIGLTKGLAKEGAPHGIKVNAIMPAAYTRLNDQVPNKDLVELLKKRFPVHQVAPVAVFLVHENVPCTGEVFSSGGGRTLRVVLAETKGFVAEDHTLEELDENFKQIMNPEGIDIISSVEQEMGNYFRQELSVSDKELSLF